MSPALQQRQKGASVLGSLNAEKVADRSAHIGHGGADAQLYMMETLAVDKQGNIFPGVLAVTDIGVVTVVGLDQENILLTEQRQKFGKARVGLFQFLPVDGAVLGMARQVGLDRKSVV